jgi:hypothetical protein
MSLTELRFWEMVFAAAVHDGSLNPRECIDDALAKADLAVEARRSAIAAWMDKTQEGE